MGLKNTKDTYGSVAKWFHWLTALCFLMLYVTTYYRSYFMEDRRSDWGHEVVQIHLMFGWTVMFLLLPRLIWKLTNVQPLDPPGKWWEHLGAKLGHWALYLLAVAFFLTGYFGTHDDTHYLHLFYIPQFQDTAIFHWAINTFSFTWEDFESPMDWLHRDLLGKWAALVLIFVHVAAALYHHFYKRDTVLVRMLPGNEIPKS